MDFSDIYNEYFRDVFHFVLSLSRDGNIAEEITQETFMRALRQLDSYDGVRDHRAWLFTIARTSVSGIAAGADTSRQCQRLRCATNPQVCRNA